MWPFECLGIDGRIYFHFDNWTKFLTMKQKEYPPTLRHKRLEFTLIYPRIRLEEVFSPIGPISHNDIRYYNNNWSSIFDIYPAHCFTADGDNSIKIIVEEGHFNPWGERVTILSDDSNAFENGNLNHNKRNFVFLRGFYWKILSSFALN